jgi:hypothetical protein
MANGMLSYNLELAIPMEGVGIDTKAPSERDK